MNTASEAEALLAMVREWARNSRVAGVTRLWLGSKLTTGNQRGPAGTAASLHHDSPVRIPPFGKSKHH